MKTYTAGDMHHAWHRGWMAGWSDYARDEVELTPNPYDQTEEDHGQPPSIAVVSEIQTPCKE